MQAYEVWRFKCGICEEEYVTFIEAEGCCSDYIDDDEDN